MESQQSEAVAQEQDGQIAITILTRDRIGGVLTTDDHSFTFHAQSTGKGPSVAIVSPTGQELFAVERIDDDIQTRIADGRLTTRVSWSRAKELLAPRLRDTTTSTAPEGSKTADHPSATPRDIHNAYVQLNSIITSEGDTAAVEEFRSTPTYGLLPDLSLALGAVGFTGPSHRPSIALHVLGLRAGTDLNVSPKDHKVSYRVMLPQSLRPMVSSDIYELMKAEIWECVPPEFVEGAIEWDVCGASSVEERCEEYPNQDRECFGMCGPACDDCWRSVCGDCCYHDFCASHDVQMRQCSDTPNPLACIWATIGAPIWFVAKGGCDGWF